MSTGSPAERGGGRGERGFRHRLFGGTIGGLLSRSGSSTAAAADPDDAAAFDPASNVCLLTIMTQERTASLHRMLGVWDGHVSIALLVDSYDEAAPEGMELLKYKGRLPPAPQRITLSIVEDRGYRAPNNRFPYNVLRNVALEGCTSDYVMAADVDFVPYPTRPSAALRRALVELNVRDGAKNVLVLAAFEEGLNAEQPAARANASTSAGGAAAAASSSFVAGSGGRRLGGSGGRRLGGSVPAEWRAPLDKAELLRRVRAGSIVGFASRE